MGGDSGLAGDLHCDFEFEFEQNLPSPHRNGENTLNGRCWHGEAGFEFCSLKGCGEGEVECEGLLFFRRRVPGDVGLALAVAVKEACEEGGFMASQSVKFVSRSSTLQEGGRPDKSCDNVEKGSEEHD